MTAQTWLELILTTLSIIAIIASAVKWYIQTHLKPMDIKIDELCESIADIRSETKSNGGSSMRDEIKMIKTHQEEADYLRRQMDKKLDNMYNILIDYIASKK